MAMCAGVQKVSRPMERCHETSQAPPMEEEVTAKAPHQMYQGTLEVFDATRALVCLSAYGVGKVEEAMGPRSQLASILYVCQLSFCHGLGGTPPGLPADKPLIFISLRVILPSKIVILKRLRANSSNQRS